jgi:hypothetical protein
LRFPRKLIPSGKIVHQGRHGQHIERIDDSYL